MSQRDMFERARRDRTQQEPPPGRASVFGITPTDPRVLVQKDGTIRVGALKLTKRGIDQEGTPTPEDLMVAGALIQTISDRYNILAGDWLARAELTWTDTYREVAEKLGYEIGSLRNYKSVMSRVDLSLRNDELTFNHYNAVVSKFKDDEQVAYWLNRAVNEKMSYRQLSGAIESAHPTPQPKIDRAAKVFTQSRQKYQRIFKQFSGAGAAQRAQISQMIDEQIAELEQMKERLQEKR